LIKKAIRNATKEEADRIRKAIREGRVGEILPELVKLAERDGPLDVFYLSESRFVPVEEQDEVLNETEETVEEEDLEPVGESEEVVENDEYLGQHVVKRVFPETGERPRLRKRPF
jgi:putative transposon-encoded protein